jgi:glycosyltransferase A (GT-A) superfamily protein (DUF2064 family)
MGASLHLFRNTDVDMPGGRTAILFFSHRPEREWQNKQFVRGDYATHRQVATAFYEHSRRAVENSGLPVVEVNGAQQRGDDFGTRLANAVADVFAKGYDRVIAVGSDCPRLHEVDWGEVTARLERGAAVLGPTPDRDGVYLIGLSRTQFDRQSFAALPWKTPALGPALTKHLLEQGARHPVSLAPRGDVNHQGDLAALLRDERAHSSLLVRLRAALGAACPAARTRTRSSQRAVRTGRPRAPPARHVLRCP